MDINFMEPVFFACVTVFLQPFHVHVLQIVATNYDLVYSVCNIQHS